MYKGNSFVSKGPSLATYLYKNDSVVDSKQPIVKTHSYGE